MQFDETEGQRADLALQQLSNGSVVSFRGVSLQLLANGTLECIAFSQWESKNVTDATAREDLSVAKKTLDDLLASPSFAALVGSRPRTWELRADYGKGAVRLCRFDGETIHWSQGFPRS
jgi:hypothetical protein